PGRYNGTSDGRVVPPRTLCDASTAPSHRPLRCAARCPPPGGRRHQGRAPDTVHRLKRLTAGHATVEVEHVAARGDADDIEARHPVPAIHRGYVAAAAALDRIW